MRTTTEALSSVIDKIVNREILLPDFQRGFVWNDEEKQSKLVASVLAKMPVGSILLLSSNSNDYAYKLIGCKERKTSAELGITGEILALLDGQQRVTVLTNAFSNVIFEMAGNAKKLISQSALKRRFFLRIPQYKAEEGSVQDFFNVRGLNFPYRDVEKEEPVFLTDEIYEAIKVVNFNAGGEDCFNPFDTKKHAKSELIGYCSTGKEYLVPLYLLTGKNNSAWLTSIVKRIAENVILDILDDYDGKEDKLLFVKSVLTEEIQELAENPDNIDDKTEFEKELRKQGDNWATALIAYLNSCLNNIQLNQIIVDNHKRARAINIYENLNKGGVPLGTFELVMAKFASISDENYNDKILNNIKRRHSYPEEVFSSKLKNNDDIKKYIYSEEYNASLKLRSVDLDNDVIASAYLDAYLDVISLYSHCPDFDISKLNVNLVKRDKILAVSAHDLKNKCDEVCEALDLAMFFLQMRCGVRSIKEMNYNLILVVLAYLLLNPSYKKVAKIYDYLDAWYWIIIFSGYFNTDQTERAIVCIKNLILLFETDDKTWIKGLEQNVFKVDYFTEKEFLLLNKNDGTGIYPKEFLRDVICQFFMINTYKGLYDANVLVQPFTEEVLEKHHVIPLGSLKIPDEKISKGDKQLRKKREYFLNSPVNFIYVTKDENIAILDEKIADYTKRITNYASKSLLGLIGEFDTSTEETCRKILSNRYDDIYGKVMDHIQILIP